MLWVGGSTRIHVDILISDLCGLRASVPCGPHHPYHPTPCAPSKESGTAGLAAEPQAGPHGGGAGSHQPNAVGTDATVLPMAIAQSAHPSSLLRTWRGQDAGQNSNSSPAGRINVEK